MNSLHKFRVSVAKKVRELRRGRRWTQRELARRLQLSQARLSEIERGKGSFTAEQFLLILEIFNVGLSHFVAAGETDADLSLQNALARLGAWHLHEREDVLPSERLEDVNDVVRETLVAGSPRQITALGPVLIRNIDRVKLGKVHASLVQLGLERRLPWLIDSLVDVIAMNQPGIPRSWAKNYRRSLVVFEDFLRSVAAGRGWPANESLTTDMLDPEIRTKRTLDEVRAESSAISRRWGIITRLMPEDFSRALAAADASV